MVRNRSMPSVRRDRPIDKYQIPNLPGYQGYTPSKVAEGIDTMYERKGLIGRGKMNYKAKLDQKVACIPTNVETTNSRKPPLSLPRSRSTQAYQTYDVRKDIANHQRILYFP